MSHVNNEKIAKQILQPLLQLPRLRSCGIYLGTIYDASCDQLRGLAKMAVQRLTRDPAAELPFRLLDLPVELQLRVLEFSSIVLPTEVCASLGRYLSRSRPHNCVISSP